MTRNLAPGRRPRAAFTLLEMLIVIALIALLMGTLIVNFDKMFGGGQEDVARIWVNTTARTALGTYRLHTGNYPTTAQGLKALLTKPDSGSDRWRGPYLMEHDVPKDPWGHEYQYRYPGTKNTDSYDVFSLGPDGVESADDIGNW